MNFIDTKHLKISFNTPIEWLVGFHRFQAQFEKENDVIIKPFVEMDGFAIGLLFISIEIFW